MGKAVMNEAARSELARMDAAAATLRMAGADGSAEIALVLGSGLGQIAEAIEESKSVAYSDIPGFPRSTVSGHAGRFIFGTWQGRKVAAMQGRFHAYERYAPADLALPIRVLRRLGVRRLILTNAAGGVNPSFTPGDLMLITDHLGLFAQTPLRGPNIDEIGVRFPDQSAVYDPEWRRVAAERAGVLGIPIQQGVYFYTRGPQYETPAEIQAIRMLGGDAVGMSTVPEAIAASHAGMTLLAISCITNYAAGIQDGPLTHQEVMDVGQRAGKRLAVLIADVLEQLTEER